jgi:hypothetical protein
MLLLQDPGVQLSHVCFADRCCVWLRSCCSRSAAGQAAAAAVTTSTTTLQRTAVAPATAAAAAVTIPTKAVGSGKPSSFKLYGKAAAAAAFTAQTLEEWTVPGCKDSVVSCGWH